MMQQLPEKHTHKNSDEFFGFEKVRVSIYIAEIRTSRNCDIINLNNTQMNQLYGVFLMSTDISIDFKLCTFQTAKTWQP